MRKDELVERAITAVQCALDGGPAEDSFVEFKAAFPDLTTSESTAKAARQLAAQANAAAPDPFIWLIGVEENTGKVRGADKKELSNWCNRVAKPFDGKAPTLSLSAIVHDFDKPLVAVLFETNDAPYVVNLPNSRDKVVPWREATFQRCASRSELLKLFTHHRMLPDVRIMEGSKKTSLIAHGTQNAWSVRLRLTLYLENTAPKRIILPVHRCSGWFESPPLVERTSFTDFDFLVKGKRVSQTIINDAEEVEVRAGVVLKIPEPHENPATAEIRLGVVGVDKPLVVRVELPLGMRRPISLSHLQANRRRHARYF